MYKSETITPWQVVDFEKIKVDCWFWLKGKGYNLFESWTLEPLDTIISVSNSLISIQFYLVVFYIKNKFCAFQFHSVHTKRREQSLNVFKYGIGSNWLWKKEKKKGDENRGNQEK